MPQFLVKLWWDNTQKWVGEIYVRIQSSGFWNIWKWYWAKVHKQGWRMTQDSRSLGTFPGTVLPLGWWDPSHEKSLWNLLNSTPYTKRGVSTKQGNRVSPIYRWELSPAHLLHCTNIIENDNEKWQLAPCAKHQTNLCFCLKLSIDQVKVSSRRYHMQTAIKLEVKEVWPLTLLLQEISINRH